MPQSAHFMAPQGGGFEPQRTFDFELEIYGIPGAENIKLAVDSAFIPLSTNEVITVNYLGEERKVAGKAKFAGGSIVVKDFVDEDIAGNLQAWRDLVYDPQSGAIGRATQYKKQGNLILFAPDFSGSRSFKLEGVWPSGLSASNLSYANSGVVNVTLAITFDRAYRS